jgi:hypothetical protein
LVHYSFDAEDAVTSITGCHVADIFIAVYELNQDIREHRRRVPVGRS